MQNTAVCAPITFEEINVMVMINLLIFLIYNNLQLKKIIFMHNAGYKNEIDKMDVLTTRTNWKPFLKFNVQYKLNLKAKYMQKNN